MFWQKFVCYVYLVCWFVLDFNFVWMVVDVVIGLVLWSWKVVYWIFGVFGCSDVLVVFVVCEVFVGVMMSKDVDVFCYEGVLQ